MQRLRIGKPGANAALPYSPLERGFLEIGEQPQRPVKPMRQSLHISFIVAKRLRYPLPPRFGGKWTFRHSEL
jgi:hypothetical protein